MKNSVYDPKLLQAEILASHERSRAYGIDPDQNRAPEGPKLTAAELDARRSKNQYFYDFVVDQIDELYHLLAGKGFSVSVTDGDGYILEVIGDKNIVEQLRVVNCWPGYRWQEKDVGTSSISLVLATGIAVQVTSKESYCKRGNNFTNSAAPVFSPDQALLGVIAVTGIAEQVHPHTLAMVKTAAKAIENQIGLKRKSEKLYIQRNYMASIIDSIEDGFIATDRRGIITHINISAIKILELGKKKAVGQSLPLILAGDFDWTQAIDSDVGFVDREVFVTRKGQVPLHLLVSLDLIRGPYGRVRGVAVMFNSINRIRKLVTGMSGAHARFTFDDIIGCSQEIEAAKTLAAQAAKAASPVLITGETGTGKELFAHSIHNSSNRRDKPFVIINCAAIPRDLLESELFGYGAGAFTGARKSGQPGKLELANSGTVFLDEIGDMAPDMQVKLLRAIQSGEVCRLGEHKHILVDIRFITATNVDLEAEIKRRNFRLDLYYRINVLSVSLPPLRRRVDDILPLANHLLARSCRKLGKEGLSFSKAAKGLLESYDWPGNVRELENAVERAANLCKSSIILPDDLGLPSVRHQFSEGRDTERLLETAEFEILERVFTNSNRNIALTSRKLGISRPTLYRKLRKSNLIPS